MSDLALAPANGRTLDVVAAEIKGLTASMLSTAIEIGRRMQEAKSMLPRGGFEEWVEANTDYKHSSAKNFIRIFEEYGNRQGSLFAEDTVGQTFGRLSYSKALALLSVPTEERETFAEEVEAEHISVRELKRRIAEHEEEAAAARKSAEEEAAKRLQAERDLEGVRYELQMSRQAGMELGEENRTLKAELDAAKTSPITVVDADDMVIAEATQAARAEAVAEMQGELDKANEAVKQSAKAAESLRKELDALKKSPPADQVVEEKIRKATEEAVSDVQRKLEKAEADKRQSDEKRKAAEKALDEANEAARQSAKTAENLRKELDAAASKHQQAEAASSDRALYKILCQQITDAGNRLHALMLEAEHGGDPQLAGGIRKAFGMISRKFAECAGNGNAPETSGATEGGGGNDGTG